ncbi:hypothetical protein WR25_24931 [Diploscapter pachys]|uniref:Uncharacterized protein n=1 Tax=Diploscapter pachys TaxID=2018661 RepID=A0A2A2J2M8_9BILA|nr:hypothetical protein WR25_24931 [Diploscapter pachys]
MKDLISGYRSASRGAESREHERSESRNRGFGDDDRDRRDYRVDSPMSATSGGILRNGGGYSGGQAAFSGGAFSGGAESSRRAAMQSVNSLAG